MYEKTCDKKIRLEKVNKVKTKILAVSRNRKRTKIIKRGHHYSDCELGTKN